MNAIVAKLPGGRRVNFKVNFPCTCGEARSVFGHGIDPTLPLNNRARNLGPCRACRRSGTWRILDRGDEYLVEVTPDA